MPSVDSERYGSAGCQVICGAAQTEARGDRPDAGPWADFRRNAYELEQSAFDYLLVSAATLKAVVAGGSGLERTRFGSSGPRARGVQQALHGKGFYKGAIDGEFGLASVRALMAFQTAEFGPLADDGVAGPATRAALGL